ncbi:MAG: hypothetical protein PWQ70_722 [Clostridiales bacterium]|jgi:two-component system response regulator ResD|nr:hypothetical protein [Clostridiales bacterium]
MNGIKILVVDDEDKIRNVIKIYLNSEGYAVEEANNGKNALDKIKTTHFSLIILDVMMPEIDGWTVCREIRKSSSVPIIMLTARGEEYDKLFGFDLGVDDYIVKPFSPKEMIARVKALLRRSGNKASKSGQTFIEVGQVKVNPVSKQAFISDKELILTPKEFELLYFLVQNPERVFNREQLLTSVWGYDFFGDSRTVDTHIKQLREKLGDYKHYIHTVWGTGYKFNVGD